MREEKKLVPKRRFKEYQNTNAWEQRKVQWLIDEGIIEEPMDGNHGEKHPTASEYVDNGIPFLMATDIKNGIVDIHKCNFITLERSKKLDKGFAKNGDVLITHKATIGEVAILSGLSSEYAVLTPQVTYYRVIDKSRLAMNYLYAYFNSPDFQNILKVEATQSTRSYIGITGQHKLDVKFPTALKEQEKIGDYFSDLDHLITLHERKLEKTKALKSAYLSEMFPAEGECEPRRRFAGFTDAWEQRRLGEVVTIKSGWSPSNFSEGTSMYVKVDDLNYSNRVQNDSQMKVQENSRYSKVKIGSTIFPKRGAAIMTNKVRILAKDSYMDTNMMALEPNSINGEFLYMFICRTGLYKIADTSTIPQINNKHIEPYEILMPSMEEQAKIGDFFSNVDHLITLQQRKLEKLQNIKKAYLNEMFV